MIIDYDNSARDVKFVILKAHWIILERALEVLVTPLGCPMVNILLKQHLQRMD